MKLFDAHTSIPRHAFPQSTGWIPHNHSIRWNLPRHDGASSDHRVFADRQKGHHSRIHADHRAASNPDITYYSRGRPERNKIADLQVMAKGTAPVDQAAGANN